jgi:hypothetical protein
MHASQMQFGRVVPLWARLLPYVFELRATRLTDAVMLFTLQRTHTHTHFPSCLDLFCGRSSQVHRSGSSIGLTSGICGRAFPQSNHTRWHYHEYTVFFWKHFSLKLYLIDFCYSKRILSQGSQTSYAIFLYKPCTYNPSHRFRFVLRSINSRFS